MRKLLGLGLAVASGFSLLSPASAQQSYMPILNRYDSQLSTNHSTPARPSGWGRLVQDPVTPSAVPTEPTPAADTASAPTPPAAAAESGSGCKTSGSCNSSYFDQGNCGRDANWVIGVGGLAFRRDYEDDLGLSAVPSDLSQYLNSTSAKMGTMGGVEVSATRRGCDGSGFEVRYWGLYPDTSEALLSNSPYTNLVNLNQVEFGGFPVSQVYNRGFVHGVYRDNTFHNLEFNFLRALGSSDCGNRNWEWLAGFRYFSFDEDFSYATFTQAASYPPEFYYENCVENDLYGFQVGARSERCWSGRWGTQFGTKVGIYTNHIEACQAMHDAFPAYAVITSGPYAGTDYTFESSKDDFAMAGELNLGLTYQWNCNWRSLLGYRAIGVSGVALAPDQIPVNFSDAQDIQRIKSNGSLILHGVYFGVERCF
jgi:hypothetical protein